VISTVCLYGCFHFNVRVCDLFHLQSVGAALIIDEEDEEDEKFINRDILQVIH